jgi:hypothetical protein
VCVVAALAAIPAPPLLERFALGTSLGTGIYLAVVAALAVWHSFASGAELRLGDWRADARDHSVKAHVTDERHQLEENLKAFLFQGGALRTEALVASGSVGAAPLVSEIKHAEEFFTPSLPEPKETTPGTGNLVLQGFAPDVLVGFADVSSSLQEGADLLANIRRDAPKTPEEIQEAAARVAMFVKTAAVKFAGTGTATFRETVHKKGDPPQNLPGPSGSSAPEA